MGAGDFVDHTPNHWNSNAGEHHFWRISTGWSDHLWWIQWYPDPGWHRPRWSSNHVRWWSRLWRCTCGNWCSTGDQWRTPNFDIIWGASHFDIISVVSNSTPVIE